MSSEKGSYEDRSHSSAEDYDPRGYRDRPYSATSSREGYRDGYRPRGRGGYRGRGNDYYGGRGSYGNRYDSYYGYGPRRGGYGSSYGGYRGNYRSENYEGYEYGDNVNADDRRYETEEPSGEYSGSYNSYRGGYHNSKYRDSYSGRGSYGYRGRGGSYSQTGGYNSGGSSHEKEVGVKPVNMDFGSTPPLKHKHSHSQEPTVKSFSNPWISILQITDEGLQNTLESRHKELQQVDKELFDLQRSYSAIQASLKKLEVQTAREELHVQLANEKLEEFAFL